jgi:signal transduction histidine kinase
VLDDGCTASAAEQNAMAGAIGEAVTNAIKHAEASSIVVFVETNDSGDAYASVRDDGIGFDTADGAGRGIIGSIHERMADVGGRSTVRSTPGQGTEVELWTT